MDDKTIIALYFSRDEQALAETEQRYGDYCRSIALRMLHSREDAQECLNDTLLRAWNAIPPTVPQSLRLWLGRVTRNLSLTRLQKQERLKRGGGEAEQVLSELETAAPERLEEHLEAEELAAEIGRYLRSIRKLSRLAFVGRYYYFDSLSDIAARLGISERQVSQLLFRARRGLKKYLEERGYTV
jgi:RNA polymerase sigma-70 factor (ECF subfamily)